MSIVNTTATAVPFGYFEGMDLQEFATEHTRAARELMKEPRLLIEFSDHYYDLDFYLMGLPRAKRDFRRLP